MQFNATYVYPPDKVRPVVNAVVARNPAACEAEINVGRCRAFSITPKSNRICFFLFAKFPTNDFNSPNGLVTIGLGFGWDRAVAILTLLNKIA
jgi:hypothetical protein